MTVIDLMKSMGEMGVIYSKKNLDDILDYCALMLYDERVVRIDDEGKPVAFLFYSMTDDPEKFLKKKDYEYLPHDIEAETVYVEKLVSFFWKKEFRRLFEAIIAEKYPKMKQGVWHRRGDRKVISKRRHQNVQH